MSGRIVRQLDSTRASDSRVPGQSSFREFFEFPNIVLLGEPGAGKSHLFDQASIEEGAKFFTVRSFLVSAHEPLKDSIVYIDALDEQRTRGFAHDQVDALIEKLWKLRPSKVRISCRVTDWLGESDWEVFGPYFEQAGGSAILLLEPLSESEQLAILADSEVTDPAAFVAEAQSRGVGSLLGNPQTLIMLAKVVKAGDWPTTRRDLFLAAASEMIAERNHAHIQPLGVPSVGEVRSATGAMMAAMLISDVVDVGLDEAQDEETPSFSNSPYPDSEVALNALSRRVFVSNPGHSCTYTHRTIAEFLAAEWAAEKIRNGFPLSRIIAVIGSERIPAPELRGFHAWLATLLDEYAAQLISADPLGVLAYGDAASLTLTHRRHLLSCMSSLAKENPWFLSSEHASQSFGALSGPDLADEFADILGRVNSPQHLRLVVLEALAQGGEVPALKEPLIDIITSRFLPGRERILAFEALLVAFPSCERVVTAVYASGLGNSRSSLEVRARIIAEYFSTLFSAADIRTLLTDASRHDTRLTLGCFWPLERAVEPEHTPGVLNELLLMPPEQSEHDDDWFGYELGRFLVRLIEKALPFVAVSDATDVWRWLKRLSLINRHHGTDHSNEIKARLSDDREFLDGIFNAALNELPDEWNHFSFWHDFNEATFHTANPVRVSEIILRLFEVKEEYQATDQPLFSLASWIITNHEEAPTAQFETIVKLSDQYGKFAEILPDYLVCPMVGWRRENVLRQQNRRAVQEEILSRNRIRFEEDRSEILNGTNLSWMRYIGQIYFSRSVDMDIDATPVARLTAFLGEDLVDDSLNGARALLKNRHMPLVADVIDLFSEKKHYEWWYAIIAGIEQEWASARHLSDLEDNVLGVALIVAEMLAIKSERSKQQVEELAGWYDWILRQRPSIAASTMRLMTSVDLSRNEVHIHGLYELCTRKELESVRESHIIALLDEFSDLDARHLEIMLSALLDNPVLKRDLVRRCRTAIGSDPIRSPEALDVWYAVSMTLEFEEIRPSLEQWWKERKGFCWNVRWCYNFSRRDGSYSGRDFTEEMLGFSIKMIGTHFENAPHPQEGWSGDTNDWDASELVRQMINDLSSRASSRASDEIRTLLETPVLATFHEHIRYAAHNQRHSVILQGYRQPSWKQTVSMLRGETPANSADLQALVLDLLRDLQTYISHSNVDVYKSFWNEDSRAQPTNPKVEDSCRDRLIEILSPRLRPYSVTRDPEAHLAQNRRADILFRARDGHSVPLEAKRDFNSELWTACKDQLEDYYTNDPHTSGFGIYLVFWFGDARTRSIPLPPDGIERPNTPHELQLALEGLVSPGEKERLAIHVLDVSAPS